MFPSSNSAASRLLGAVRRSPCALLTAFIAIAPACAHALNQPQYVRFTPGPGAFTLAANGAATPICVDPADWPGVLRAAHDLQQDIHRVTTLTPSLCNSTLHLHGDLVLIGTIGHSALIDRLIRSHKLDVSAIRGQWEATVTQTIDHPFPHVDRAFVIAGSDKRGAIYGIYDLSEDIGVSPWYWWADVPVLHRDELYIAAGRTIVPAPVVKYRGIFLNDEAPSLTGWVNRKYGGYNHLFYVKVFELLLRLRANYLWPAMWNNAFAVDDPLNAKLADEYGIVMGTSHEEPMMCAEKEWEPADGPWNYVNNQQRIDDHWRACMTRDKNYEQLVTLGMRGEGDTPMSAGANTALLEKIVANQRQILQDTVNPDLAKVPQVWALYKEVQTYYDKGMRVPDDVTLLWSDDNWGDLRRLPTPEERKRSGGAGIYYHFDYVGGPRSYKWLNTVPITKIWEQMNLAWQYDATRIWVVNVGDLKPMEFPIEFFLTMARNPAQFDPGNLDDYTRLWAAREFGPEHAPEIADLLSTYTKYNGRRKPEQLEPNTFSLTNYDEADRVYTQWQTLVERAERVNRQLPPQDRDAFFELILYPLKASAIVNQLYIRAGQNHLYATQGRVAANTMADEARSLFAADAALTAKYNHKLANGKWDHMMDQTHIGYTFWNEPPVNAMPAVSWVQPLSGPRMAVALEGSPFAASGSFPPLTLPAFDSITQQTRTVDVFNRGDQPFTWTASTDQPWIRITPPSGLVDSQSRLLVSIDWSSVPQGANSGTLTIQQKDGPSITVHVQAAHPTSPTRDTLDGFYEANHTVSIEAAHFTSQTTAGPAHWVNIPGYGETLSGMTILPVTAPSVEPPRPAPTLDYRMFLTDSGPCSIEARIAPTLNYVPGRGLRYAVSFDGDPPRIVDALADNSQHAWEQAVSDGVRKVVTPCAIAAPGYHTLHVRMVDPGIVLEKLIVAFSNPAARFPGTPALPAAPPSYLGPPESYVRLTPPSPPTP
ncbi:MAG TPA: glycosyl hydrolase 115 family protein [Acidobacteriaceae bacterium]|jgi:hypothetical protein|nr:glycosyl hydrolase 115 family protein [Acidobacteriaceae bacterium]